ncbi:MULTISPECIES: IclR family transcriptional regulator domain-containing protein [Ramlibacter]|nr:MULTISPECIES: IclR family transcriptional regulator C-terminal domain-containing protein [Ramlibacter]MBA2962296.1 helix-turn-helix domain-containing protein [Ramlibacter sp. CGMCC 1.13660]
MSSIAGDAEVTAGAGPRRNDQFVEAFAKGLQVIRAFPSQRQTATLAEIAQNAEMPRATVRRMLLTLVELGYATQDVDRFALTPKLLDLGFVYLHSIPLYRSAQDVLEALARELNELCSLTILDGTETVYLVHVQGRDFLGRGMGVGARLPAYATSFGRVLLGALDQQEREQRLDSSPISKLTPNTLTDRAALAKAIEAAGRDGYSLVVEELVAGVIGMSVPVRDRRGKVVAAAGISFNPVRFKKRDAIEHYLPHLRRAADQITLSLP